MLIRHLVRIITFIYLKVYGLFSILSLMNLVNRNTGFPDYKITQIRILRNMIGTILGDGERPEALKKPVRQLVSLQAFEEGFFKLAIDRPRLFLNYLFFVLYPSVKEYFNVYGKGSGRLYLFHNFIGARLGIVLKLVHLAERGENAIVLIDESAAGIIPEILSKIYPAPLKNKGGGMIEIEIKHYRRFFKDENCVKSVFRFYNVGKAENLFKLFRELKTRPYNLLMVPEADRYYENSIKAPFLGSSLRLPGGLVKFIHAADGIYSMVTDCGSGFDVLKFHTVIYQCRDGNAANLVKSIIKGYERFVFINPQLYIPFDFSTIWKHRYEEKSDDNTVLETMSWKQRCLLLFSNGKIYSCSKKDLRDIINSGN